MSSEHTPFSRRGGAAVAAAVTGKGRAIRAAPPNADPTKEPDGKFRKIRVKVNRKGLRVRTRKGYYAERPGPAPG